MNTLGQILTFDGRALKTAPGIQGFNDAYFASRLEADTFGNAAVVNGMSPLRAFQCVSWLYRAVNIKAGAVQEFPFDLERVGVPDEDASEAPEFATFMDGFRDLLYMTAASRTITGAAYWYVSSDARGRNVTLTFLLSKYVTPIVQAGKLAGFSYNGPDADIPRGIALDRMVYFWAPNFEDRNRPGTGEATIALSGASMLWALDAFAAGFFNSGAVKVTVFEVPPATSNPDKEDFQNFLNRALSGVRNAFRNIVVRMGVKPTVIGSDIKDTQASELMLAQRDSVAVAIGIPPGLISGKNETYATAFVNYLFMYKETVVPAFNSISETVNRQLLSRLGLRLVPHKERLEVMQSAQLEQAQAISLVVGAPVLTVDEGRALLGYEPLTAPLALPAAETAPATAALGEGKAAVQFNAMLKALAEQRARALAAVRAGEPLPPGPDTRINAALAQATTPAQVRAAFAQHWPRRDDDASTPNVAPRATAPQALDAGSARELAAAIREAAAALRESA